MFLSLSSQSRLSALNKQWSHGMISPSLQGSVSFGSNGIRPITSVQIYQYRCQGKLNFDITVCNHMTSSCWDLKNMISTYCTVLRATRKKFSTWQTIHKKTITSTDNKSSSACVHVNWGEPERAPHQASPTLASWTVDFSYIIIIYLSYVVPLTLF